MGRKIPCIYMLAIISLALLLPAVSAVEEKKELEPSPFVTCFAKGTKILMADSREKNIEDIKPGDWVLSYDPITGKFGKWKVVNVEFPNRPVYTITWDGGFLKVTEDHPLWIKKPDGSVGWGQLKIMPTHVRLRGQTIYKIEVGDMLYTVNGWVKIKSIEYSEEVVEVVNIFSWNGKKTYFANGVLAYEEYPYPWYMVRFYLYKILSCKPFSMLPFVEKIKELLIF